MCLNMESHYVKHRDGCNMVIKKLENKMKPCSVLCSEKCQIVGVATLEKLMNYSLLYVLHLKNEMNVHTEE